MFIYHLAHVVLQQDNELVERLYFAVQLYSVDQKDIDLDVLLAKSVQKRFLQLLPFSHYCSPFLIVIVKPLFDRGFQELMNDSSTPYKYGYGRTVSFNNPDIPVKNRR